MEKVLSIINNIMAMVCFSLIYGHWQKSQVRRFFGCCTADSQADKDQNQLNNNFKIVQLETSASDWFPVNPVLFFPPSGHVTETDAAYLSTLFDVGGIAGGIAAGLISDTTGKSASTCAVMLVAAIPSVRIHCIGGKTTALFLSRSQVSRL